MSARALPVLVFDGDCAFCTRSARLAARLVGSRADVVAGQFLDLDDLGLTPAQVDAALQWVELDGAVSSGHLAIAALLRRAGLPWSIPGRLLTWPVISALAARVYRWVAANRDRMPGGTAACAVPAAERPRGSTRS